MTWSSTWRQTGFVWFRLLREGANHSIYTNGPQTIPVKRHRQFDRITANELCKQAAKKVYQAVGDPASEERGLLRIIDESGEDYLYPARLFVPIKVPQEAERAFAIAS